ncbi:phosphoribosylformylglycinamidine synthase subunit PurS [Weissella paramesenteroides]|uniref:Phosphoribosylformylglycinamidine synthase subunit PurS n=1 Tax=Weissella paramesenteroides ATCC 33313 TaxID=585506 RepID=C5RAY0_WEIPA|nr:phosphoribosylformylglycinamidine synthase subunit PurS [Weissella paramesenteroides]ATF41784.1 phosphoribosylformylglycinamidine synthase [Weissella paramesenteroides]EER74649.1 phosphoribosylformylglycinamidine synthase, purS protein [Weissella paramesenteroides ATCC 33313]RZQ58740.1 phosphoribosylformylglycinamidine synthase subunit PurS [Weissella paramesenteroides]
MTVVKVFVNYKESILNPEAEAIKQALGRLGYDDIIDLKVGKTFELTFADQLSHDKIEHEVNEICDRMLANFNMENYRYEISDSEAIQ